jgi:hypothetical protein
LLTSWANYLSNSSVDTVNQYVTSEDEPPSVEIANFDLDRLNPDEISVGEDSLSPSNQTNLAIKGIIAIEAMSAMSLAAGNIDDANKYKVCHSP